VTTDLTVRIAELAGRIEAALVEDEARSLAAGDDDKARSWAEGIGGYPVLGYLVDDGWGRTVAGPSAPTEAQTRHIARNDPARVLRRVKAARELAAAILAERHDYNESDAFYSCSQAEDPDPAPGEGGPGSGCSDDGRAGQPCDCGRDQRVARLLGIIAGEWETGND
jgi:hypothetical protein